MGINRGIETNPGRLSLVDALFSSTQQRVLGLLFGQPERSFFGAEVIGLLGMGSGGVQRELKKLADPCRVVGADPQDRGAGGAVAGGA